MVFLVATARRFRVAGFDVGMGMSFTFTFDRAGVEAGLTAAVLRFAVLWEAPTFAFGVEGSTSGAFSAAASRNSSKLTRKSSSNNSMSGTA